MAARPFPTMAVWVGPAGRGGNRQKPPGVSTLGFRAGQCGPAHRAGVEQGTSREDHGGNFKGCRSCPLSAAGRLLSVCGAMSPRPGQAMSWSSVVDMSKPPPQTRACVTIGRHAQGLPPLFFLLRTAPGLCSKGRGAIGAVPERLQSGHMGCDGGWGGGGFWRLEMWLGLVLGCGNAFGVESGQWEGGRGGTPPFQRFPGQPLRTTNHQPPKVGRLGEARNPPPPKKLGQLFFRAFR